MNNQDPREEQAFERWLGEAVGPQHRPDPKLRQATWERLRQEWRAERQAATVPERSDAARTVEPSGEPARAIRQNHLDHSENNNQRSILMSLILKLNNRWGFGLGAAAAGAAVLGIVLLSTPNAHARAAEVMARGAEVIAKLTTIHLRGQLRTLPADNFSYINPDNDFHTIELWKEFGPQLKWRVEKPGRVVVMDGLETVHYIKQANTGVRITQSTPSAFDTDWLHRIANLSQTISNDLREAQSKGWSLDLTSVQGADGRKKAVVTIIAKTGVPEGDYVKNSFFGTADTRRVYRFDDATERLEAVQIYLLRKGGEVQIFDLSQIDFDQPIAPEIWKLQLPANVSWYQAPQKLPDNDRYVAMTPEQAARAFFQACSAKDWTEAAKFMSPLNDRLKEHLGGLQLVGLGQPFGSAAYGGRFVPYEIKLRPLELNLRLSNANAAKRFVVTGVFNDKLEPRSEIKWPAEPAAVPEYAKLSAAEAAKAYCTACANLDYQEMARFIPDTEVQTTKRQAEEAVKQGADPKQIMPVLEPGEASWSAEQNAWFVKCRVSMVRKHNLALRKDNPAGRWQVDGGI